MTYLFNKLPIRLIDKYIFSEFIKTFIGTLIMLTGILLISQVMDNMKDFIASKESSTHIFLFLLYTIPKLISSVIAPALMFATCFIVGQFSSNKELVSIMAAGVSFYRIVSPLIIFGILMWFFVLFINEIVARPFNTLAAYEYTMIKKGIGVKTDLVYQLNIRGKEGFYYVYWYDNDTKTIRGGFNYIKVNQQNLAELIISAQNAVYNSKENHWKLEKVEEIQFDSQMMVKSYNQFNEKVYVLPESADYFAKPIKKVEEMNFYELTDEMELRKGKGIPFYDLEVERHAIFAVPIMNVIVVIIGAIAGSMTKRSAGVASLGITIAVVLLYYILYSTGRSLAERGGLLPSVGVWSTSIVFLLLSFGLYKKYNL